MPTSSSSSNRDRVELEVLECHEDQSSDSDDKQQTRPKSCGNHKKYLKKGRRVKLKTQSCGSLCSLSSLKKTATSVKSEPNVHYEIEDDTVNININQDDEYNDEKSLSGDATRDDTTVTVNGETGTAPSVSTEDELEKQEKTSSAGFKSSLVTILSRLGLWRSSDCRQTIVPPQRISKLPPEKGPPPAINRRQYVRGYSFGGNINKLMFVLLIFFIEFEVFYLLLELANSVTFIIIVFRILVYIYLEY